MKSAIVVSPVSPMSFKLTVMILVKHVHRAFSDRQLLVGLVGFGASEVFNVTVQQQHLIIVELAVEC